MCEREEEEGVQCRVWGFKLDKVLKEGTSLFFHPGHKKKKSLCWIEMDPDTGSDVGRRADHEK